MVERVGLDERIAEQVQVLQAEPAEVRGQRGQLVVCRRQEPQLGEPAHAERQTGELVVVQLEVHQFLELAELRREPPQSVLAEVQDLEGPLQRGQAQRLAEGLQVVVVEDELGEAAEVPDGGGELLDVVVAEVQLAESCTNKKGKETLQLREEGNPKGSEVQEQNVNQDTCINVGSFYL